MLREFPDHFVIMIGRFPEKLQIFRVTEGAELWAAARAGRVREDVVTKRSERGETR
jgi:hypothetical protein